MWKDSETKIDFLDFDYLTKTITDIFLEGESITNLTEASYIIFFAGMESTNGSPPENQVIQILEDYTLGLVLSLKAKVLVDPDNL